MNIKNATNTTINSTRSARIEQTTGPSDQDKSITPPPAPNIVSTLVDTVSSGAFILGREVKEVHSNDPALVVRVGATRLVDTVLEKVGEADKAGFEKFAVPVIRTGLLALNAQRAVKTMRDPTAGAFGKTMDVARVASDFASDFAGVVGGIAVLAFPQYAALGHDLIGLSYAADIFSHAYRGAEHGKNRMQVWETNVAAKKANQRPMEAR